MFTGVRKADALSLTKAALRGGMINTSKTGEEVFVQAHPLEQTYQDLPLDIVDEVLLVDDASRDETVTVSRRLGLTTFLHERNMGYGRNRKTCYREALKRGADIVVMVHRTINTRRGWCSQSRG